jgi:hypothetical protein
MVEESFDVAFLGCLDAKMLHLQYILTGRILNQRHFELSYLV